ncbi:putative ribonuclease H protein [Trifolium medium]|uniref:Putative ribonuclease H protein n=1 Tax=Trifolium medium TaxID=97028 RepID=A0A392PBY4_9FABA|nr:putative ribonuclease H protein [Trifolium medium]
MGRDTVRTDVRSSIWWKDVIGLGRGLEVDWFKLNVGSCVGNGQDIGVWKFKWFGNHTFRDLFPNLFAKEASQDVMIAERLNGNRESLMWYWQWSDQLSVSEEQLLDDLKELLVEALSSNVLSAINKLWRNDVPSKVNVFSWRTAATYSFFVRSVKECGMRFMGG